MPWSGPRTWPARRSASSALASASACGLSARIEFSFGPAVSYAIGQGATMVSAVWGVFIWKEFASAPPESRKLIPAMFIFFLIGLASIAIAPMFGR